MERWLIQANIARLQLVQAEQLTEAQRRAIERLIAEQYTKLDKLGRERRAGSSAQRV